jgi:hypothetical protein
VRLPIEGERKRDAMPHFKFERCDFDKWLRFDTWPIQQAALILLGQEPPPLGYLLGDPARYLYGERLNTWDEPHGYRELLDLIKNSVENKTLDAPLITIYPYSTNQVKPDDLLEWAKRKKIEFPVELAEKIPATKGQRDSETPASNTNDTPVGERERTTVRKIIAGLLMHGFKETELSQPYAVASEIEQSLQSAGIDLSKDTIAKWVKEACELIPENDKKTVKKQ